MPAFRPSGMLGEVGSGMDLAKSDNLSEGQHTGIIQDTEDWTVQWLVIVLTYLVFFPVAYVLLWRSQQIDLRAKVLVSVAGVAGIALAVYLLSLR